MCPFARVSRWGVAVFLLLATLLAGPAFARAPLDFGGSQPILLDDAGQAWLYDGGILDVDDAARVNGLHW